ncbi:MAG: hypothetical protein R3B54_05160 [Bdellovibrionota bacterium]
MSLPITQKNTLISIAWFVVLGTLLAAYAARGGLHLVSRNYNISAEANGMNGILRVADGKRLHAPQG